MHLYFTVDTSVGTSPGEAGSADRGVDFAVYMATKSLQKAASAQLVLALPPAAGLHL